MNEGLGLWVILSTQVVTGIGGMLMVQLRVLGLESRFAIQVGLSLHGCVFGAYIYIYIYMFMYMCVYIYIYICLCICVYIYI